MGEEMESFETRLFTQKIAYRKLDFGKGFRTKFYFAILNG